MTDEKNNTPGSSRKGFEGFGDLVSDVSKDIESATRGSPNPTTPKFRATAPSTSSTQRTTVQTEVPQVKKRPESPQLPSGGSGAKWFWGIYETDANNYLQPEAENIKKLAEAIRQSAHKGESSVKPLVDKLVQVVSKWDSVAQPIQLSVKARGLEHDLSHEVANTIRSLGVELFNEHDMLDTANRLTKILQELFAELPEMVEKLDQDAETLDEIHVKRKDAQKRSNEWATEIFYQAEIGLVFKDTLRISTKGVEWKGKCFPLDSITWVKWGAVSRPVNGVPTGTDYTIAVGDNRTSAVIETRKGEIFSAFTDKLWRAVCVRLLTETLEALKSGERIPFGGVVIDDKGVQLTKHKFFGNETEYRDWGKVTYGSSGGSLFITAQDDKKVYVSLPYLSTPNAHILEAMIRLSFKKWTGRLSGLLND